MKNNNIFFERVLTKYLLIFIMTSLFITNVQAYDWVVSNNQHMPPEAPISILEKKIPNNGNPTVEIIHNHYGEGEISIKFSGPSSVYEVIRPGENEKLSLIPGEYSLELLSPGITSTSSFITKSDYIYKIIFEVEDTSSYDYINPRWIEDDENTAIESTISQSSDQNTSELAPVPQKAPNANSNEKFPLNYLLITLVIILFIGIIYSKRNLFRQSPLLPMLNQSIEHTLFEISRGFSVLTNNDIKFGIRLINNSNFVMNDVDIILDYNKNLFSIKDLDVQHLGNIMPKGIRTATYILKPLNCIHHEQINAITTYKDYYGNKQIQHMPTKQVHCICPFMKEKLLSEGEFSHLVVNSDYLEEGISFNGISIEDLAKLLSKNCKNMLHKVKEFDFESKKVIYFSGESIGEKAYYLLTVVIQEYKGLTQIMFRAYSNKKYGLNGFLNEMVNNIRHLVGSVQSAKEIGIIENTMVINIIDSVVQRTNFKMEDGINNVNIKDSAIQRSNIKNNKKEE